MEKEINGRVETAFPAGILNRVDRRHHFPRALDEEETVAHRDIQLGETEESAWRNSSSRWTWTARRRSCLASEGYDPQFGARAAQTRRSRNTYSIRCRCACSKGDFKAG